MKIEPSDLVIRFAANSNEVLLLVPKSPRETGMLKRFFSVPVPAEVLVSEFADEIGVVVASFLHARHGDRFKVVESEPAGDERHASQNMAFEDSRLLIDRIGESSTLADLQAIDTLLRHASEHGDEAAASYLRDTWPQLRAVFVRRLSRK